MRGGAVLVDIPIQLAQLPAKSAIKANNVIKNIFYRGALYEKSVFYHFIFSSSISSYYRELDMQFMRSRQS